MFRGRDDDSPDRGGVPNAHERGYQGSPRGTGTLGAHRHSVRILLDENMPESLRRVLVELGHEVHSVASLRLKGIDNGRLYRDLRPVLRQGSRVRRVAAGD